MDTYSLLREFADSWFLLFMFSFFIGVCIFAFWPSLSKTREDAANIPFREDPPACTNSCATCSCATTFKELNHG